MFFGAPLKPILCKPLVWGAALLVSLTVGGCLNFKPHAIKAVRPEAWAELRVGMTKKEVIKLLGDSPGKGGPNTLEACGKKVTLPEFWEYNWTDGLAIFEPATKAYAVYFDAQGKVSKFRAPETRGPTGIFGGFFQEQRRDLRPERDRR